MKAPPCDGHVTQPREVLGCVDCGHPTDERCLPCGYAHSKVDPRRRGLVVDAEQLAADSLDKAPLCPCCRATHVHVVPVATERALAS